MNRILIIVASVFSLMSVSAGAQSGYLVTTKGDTVKGEIKILSYDLIDRVQLTDLGKKTIFSAMQLLSIGIDKTVYQPVRYENTIRFMKLLKGGFLSYYAYNTSGQNSWDGRYLTKKDGTGMEVPNLSFKKTIARYLSECAEVKTRLEKGDLSRKDIEQIVDLYNTCLHTKEDVASRPPITTFDTDKVLAVNNLIAKVEKENFVTKKDALDALKDVQSKVSKNETVPNYLMDGLKSFLSDTPSLSKDLESLLALLKK